MYDCAHGRRRLRESFERVLSSPGFVNADRASRCLRYLVEETLAGRQDAIKEYTIGVEIYGRNRITIRR